MSEKSKAPTHDQNGLHILDPNDTLGFKSEYITILQEKALKRYVPTGTGLAVDVGCGYGRLSSIINEKGWKTTGIDPDPTLVEYAKHHHPEVEFQIGKLPNLPLKEGSLQLMMLHNMLRVLKLMNMLDSIKDCGRFVSSGGYLVIVENIRNNHPDYLSESWLTKTFSNEGFSLERRIPIRASRWWLLYLIRYGLIPRKQFNSIAEYELDQQAKSSKIPKFQYFNILYIFKKNNE